MSQQDDNQPAPTTYRIRQLGPPRDAGGIEVHVHGRGLQKNEAVTGFDSLALHHPGDNRAARMEDGVVVAGQRGRVHAYVGGRLEEIEIARNGRHYGLQADQVLIKKDFILSHPDLDANTREGRMVPVPASVAGVVGARRDGEGLVDILDRDGGEVIARFRHMRGIEVDVGDRVVYGQTLGIQSDVATRNIHVHMEMDSRHYPQFRNYVDDLASGRLPVEAEHRQGVEPRPVVDDGTFRLGESSDHVRAIQHVMAGEGYRAAGGGPLDQDGVYRPGMQGALLDFQRDHYIPQTGDVDPATLRFAPLSCEVELQPRDNSEWRRVVPALVPDPAAPAWAPGHPDHPDHRPLMPVGPMSPVNQRGAPMSRFGDSQLDQLASALHADDDVAISRICADIARSPGVEALIGQGREALATQEAKEHRSQAPQQMHAPVMSHG